MVPDVRIADLLARIAWHGVILSMHTLFDRLEVEIEEATDAIIKYNHHIIQWELQRDAGKRLQQ